MADSPSAYQSYPPAMSLPSHAAGSGSGSGSAADSGSGSGAGSNMPPPGPTKPTYSKRGKITIVACVSCRRRKTKCDGKRPACGQCQARDGQCHYDMNEEQRRPSFLRENGRSLAEEKNALESVLWHLCNSTEDESFEILRRFRGGADPQSLVVQIQASRSLTQVKGDNVFGPMGGLHAPSMAFSPLRDSYEQIINGIATGSINESDDIVQRLRRREPIEHIIQSTIAPQISSSASLDLPETLHPVYQARPMIGNSLAPPLAPPLESGTGADTPSRPYENRWTQVTDDKEFIEHLLDIYFMWQHAFFQNFPEKLFRQDYENGNTHYCSRVLVNAICAAGCLLSDRPESRGDQNDPTTAGAGFFEEGMRLLNRSDASSIPTTAGVFILSHVEGYRARLGAMWGLVGRSARMAIDLGLHLRNDKQSWSEMEAEDKRHEIGRIHAFWGCFISDQVTSMTLGRLPQLLTNGVTVELPPVNQQEDNAPWGPKTSPARSRPGARAITFRECASLSKIVNSTLLMFFAPSQLIKGKLLLDEYKKYQTWYSRLPGLLAATEHAPAHIISLHLYYHAAVLLLFRPFIRAKFTESDLVPSELCRQAATAISELISKHLQLYGTTGIYTFQIQCLLAACTIHLINLPAISSTTALRNAINAFNRLVTLSTWALGSLKLIRDLVAKWKIILPGELEELLYKAHTELPQYIRERFDDPAAPRAEAALRGSKRAALLNPSATAVMQKRQRLAPVHAPTSALGKASSSTGREAITALEQEQEHRHHHHHLDNSKPAQTASAAAEQQITRSTTAAGSNSRMLFSPFPNQPAPLLGPIHTSLTAVEDWNDELMRVASDFDGLKFEGDGWFDPFIGI